MTAVRKSYKKTAMDGFPFTARWIGRPLADILAVPICRAGFTANGVTIFRIILYFASVLLLLLPQYIYTVCGAIGLILAFVLDFVDGHLARLRNEASYFGKFLDGVGDYFFPVFLTLPVAIRIGAEFEHFSLVNFSILASLLILANRMVRERSRYFLATLPKHLLEANKKNTTLIRIQRFEAFFAGHSANTRIICIFILIIPGADLVYLILMLACQLLLESCWFCLTFLHSYVALNHWRKSASAT